jgi:hypothetical protein
LALLRLALLARLALLGLAALLLVLLLLLLSAALFFLLLLVLVGHDCVLRDRGLRAAIGPTLGAGRLFPRPPLLPLPLGR